ncbi:hypothetical protein [Rhodococcus sp. NPDC058521]|uniref:hypothetical protein n=1 Tax=Rhodococcus sp. NPDC058521 TaxID=3346536 RepID=UPI003662C16E
MKDKTVAIGALGVAAFSVVSGLLVGAVGGAFGGDTKTVQAPPLVQVGLQQATAPTADPVNEIVVPPSPTWQVAAPTTPRPQTTAPAPAPTPVPESPAAEDTATPVPTTDASLSTTDEPDVSVREEPTESEAAVVSETSMDGLEVGESEAATTRPTITMPPITTRPGN